MQLNLSFSENIEIPKTPVRRKPRGRMLDIMPPDIKEVLKKFKEFTGEDIIVGHNVRFDANFLHREMKINFDENLSNNLVDTVSLAKKAYRLENYKLSTIAHHLNIDTKGAHRGLKDCEMTYLIYLDMLKKLSR